MYVFKWNPTAKEAGKVYAETWVCDPVTLDTIQKRDNLTNSDQIKNLLQQMYEYYIVVGDFANGNKYHMAKGYGTVKVETDAEGNVTNIMGGREVQLGTKVPMGHIYPQKNGRTYRLDAGMIQPPTQSVYKVLSDSVNHPEFSKFYELCVGSTDVLNTIAPVDKKGAPIQDSIKRYMIFENLNGLDMNVRTFNTYHYTVYVPTNDKIDEAYAAGLPNWYDLEVEAEAIEEVKIVKTEKEEALLEIEASDTVAINALQAEIDEMAAEIAERVKALKVDVELLVNFVKYHFQDNSVYVDNLPHSIVEGEDVKYVVDYETATLDEVTKRFCTVRVQTQQGEYDAHPTISVAGDITGMDNTCYVINRAGTEGQHYNIMTRDIEFKGSNANATIETSSYAVVHQIDGFLVNDRIFDATTQKFIK